MKEQQHRLDLTAIEALEIELIVRDFLALLHDGNASDLTAFLTEDVAFQPSRRAIVRGRAAVLDMLLGIRERFEYWHAEPVTIAVTGDVVLAELELHLRLVGCAGHRLMSFASFRVDGFRICAWHQLHG